MDQQKNSYKILVKTFAGLEDVLAEELQSIGATNTRTVRRGVECIGDTEILYKANYLCRTALRVIKPIAEFRAGNEEELYQKVLEIPWENFLDTNNTIAVDGITSYSNITHSKYLALKTKDAIADRFRKLTGQRPSVNTDNPDLRINVRIFRDMASVSIDSSGESLHMRGYRLSGGPAPLNEVLAAGMILLSGWDKTSTFIDPMCGSGTLVIEAGLIARNVPAGYFRESYAFEKWKDFDPQLWEEIKEKAKANIQRPAGKILGGDRSGRILQVARENIESAGLQGLVSVKPSYFEDFEPPEGKGVLVTNPPYGERIKTDDIEKLYKTIGDALKNNFEGYAAWIISSHLEAMKHIGLRPSRKLKLFNGQLECIYARFDMYPGTKKIHKQAIDNKPSDKRPLPKRTLRKRRNKPES